MKNSEYKIIEHDFSVIFACYKREISGSAREAVEHYIEFAEIEMACESFVLSVLEEQIQLSAEAKNDLLHIILSLGLDKESIFRVDFWQMAKALLLDQD